MDAQPNYGASPIYGNKVTQLNPEVKKSNRNYMSARNQPDKKTAAALERENERLREDVKRLKELVKLRRETTDGKILERGSVEKTARLLMRNNGAKGDARELALYVHVNRIGTRSDEQPHWESAARVSDGSNSDSVITIADSKKNNNTALWELSPVSSSRELCTMCKICGNDAVFGGM